MPGRPGNNPIAAPPSRLRAVAVQFAVLAVILAGLWAIADTTLENLDRLGVQSGFDFLGKRAGFDINQTLIDYSSNDPVWRAFLVALCNTLLLAVLAIALATAMGLTVALCRISRDWFLRGLGTAFVETFRNIPALLQIFFWYFVVLRALPSSADSWMLGSQIVFNNRGLFLPGVDWRIDAATGMAAAVLILAAAFGLWAGHRRRLSLRPVLPTMNRRALWLAWIVLAIAWVAWAADWQPPWRHRFGYGSAWAISPELGALVLGLAFYNASSVAEVIRAGFAAVPSGQWEAGRSLGLSRLQVLRQIVVPQALRVIIPPMTTCYLNIFKATSLGAAIGYPEIVSVLVGTTNNIVGRPVEIMFLTFAVYSVVSLAGIALMGWLNRRHNRFAAA